MTKNTTTALLDSITEPSFWARHRNRLLGGTAVIVLGILAFTFVRHREARAEATAWKQLLDARTPFALKDEPVDLAAVEGTSAATWALWKDAAQGLGDYYNSRDVSSLERSSDLLRQLESSDPEHYVFASGLAAELRTRIDAEMDWSRSNQAGDRLPDVAQGQTVTLVLPGGEVEIGLYPERAPESCRAFLDIARARHDAPLIFDLALEDDFVLIGPRAPKSDLPADESATEEAVPADPEGSASEAEAASTEEVAAAKDKDSDLAQGILPDRNGLSHYEGSVSFRRQDAEDGMEPRVGIYLRDNPLRDDREAVFGRVLRGLDVLREVARGAKEQENPNQLVEPVLVTDLRLGSGIPSDG